MRVNKYLISGLAALAVAGAGAAFIAGETSRKSDLGYKIEMACNKSMSDLFQNSGSFLDKINLNKPAIRCFRNAHEHFANYAWNIDIKYDKFRWR